MSDTSAALEQRFEIGRVVGQTFSVIGRNFILLFVLALLFTAPPRLLLAYGGQYLVQAGVYSIWIYAAVSFGVSILFGYLLDGAGTRVAADHLSGKRPGLFSALGTAIVTFIPLLLTGLLVLFGTMLGLIILIVPGVMFAVLAIGSAPAVVVERKYLVSAIERSANLTAGHRWGVFGLLAMNAALSYAVSLTINAIVGAATMGDLDITLPGGAGLIATSIAVVGASLLSIVSTVGVAVIYFELRRVKEGFGVEDLASVFD